MILYAVEVTGAVTNNEWSIVTIWDNEESAKQAKTHYEFNCKKNDVDSEYRIKELDTNNKCIYDYEK